MKNYPEKSGVASIYKQHFFAQLRNATGIDLENIVYYKDDTHYFVMTARTKSLLSRGVLKSTCSEDPRQLLDRSNIDPVALQASVFFIFGFLTFCCRLMPVTLLILPLSINFQSFVLPRTQEEIQMSQFLTLHLATIQSMLPWFAKLKKVRCLVY